jgi:hypothetical protein
MYHQVLEVVLVSLQLAEQQQRQEMDTNITFLQHLVAL